MLQFLGFGCAPGLQPQWEPCNSILWKIMRKSQSACISWPIENVWAWEEETILERLKGHCEPFCLVPKRCTEWASTEAPMRTWKLALSQSSDAYGADFPHEACRRSDLERSDDCMRANLDMNIVAMCRDADRQVLNMEGFQGIPVAIHFFSELVAWDCMSANRALTVSKKISTAITSSM